MTGGEAVSAGELGPALDELARLAARAGRRVCAVGRLGLRMHGLPVAVQRLQLAADGHPEGPLDATPLPGGGWSWTDPRGVPVDWIVRSDHHAPLYRAAIEGASPPPFASPFACPSGAPSPGAPPLPLLAATLLLGRDPADAALLVAAMAGGRLDPEATRDAVRTWLGVYALDDLELLIQEAEWQAMRQRYGGGGEAH